MLEPEPVEPKLFWGAGTGAVISYSGSAAEIIFLLMILVILLYCTVVSLEDARMNKNLYPTTAQQYISYDITFVVQFLFCWTKKIPIFLVAIQG